MEEPAEKKQRIEAVVFQYRPPEDEKAGAPQPGNGDLGEEGTGVDIADAAVCTTSTNNADDCAHRGSKLQRMPFYL